MVLVDVDTPVVLEQAMQSSAQLTAFRDSIAQGERPEVLALDPALGNFLDTDQGAAATAAWAATHTQLLDTFRVLQSEVAAPVSVMDVADFERFIESVDRTLERFVQDMTAVRLSAASVRT